MPYVTVGACRFFYQWDGPPTSPVLMLSNSLGSDLTMWDRQIPALARHFRVLRYDSRGHGKTDAPPGPYTIDQLGRDAAALVETLISGTVSFCGLSKGGMVGMWLGVHHPAIVRRLVLANTSANLATRSVWDDRIRAVSASGMGAVAGTVIERWFTAEFRQRSPAVVDACRRMLVSTPVQGYAACCAAIRDMDQTATISSIKHPTLVIVGDYDPATPPSHGEFIAAAIDGAELHRLPAAHLSNIEAHEEFNDVLVRFLSQPARQEYTWTNPNA
jgi:3-oxoadipate enol-lactonase